MLPPPPSAYASGIPRALDELVLALLAPDPAARPTTAAYVIDGLTSVADLPPEADERRVAESYLAHPPLCGRDAALALLAGVVASAKEGAGRGLLIEGEAGLGRTALLEAAASHAQLAGTLVLRARGEGTSSAFRLARALVEPIARSTRPRGERAPPSSIVQRRTEARARWPMPSPPPSVTRA